VTLKRCANAPAASAGIAAEVIQLLEWSIPTEKVLRSRRKAFAELPKLRSSHTPLPGPFPSSEEMIREDRER